MEALVAIVARRRWRSPTRPPPKLRSWPTTASSFGQQQAGDWRSHSAPSSLVQALAYGVYALDESAYADRIKAFRLK